MAPCPLDRTVDRAPPAVAVAVLGQLALEHLVLAEYLVVVGGDNLGEVGLGPVRELDRVPVEGAPELMYIYMYIYIGNKFKYKYKIGGNSETFIHQMDNIASILTVRYSKY